MRTVNRMEINNPRSVWTLGVQLFFTVVAMIPVFYYLKNILQLDNDARYILLFAPVTMGILLFSIQIILNEYYWYEERIMKNRDIVRVALKSFVFTMVIFYVTYLFIFGYWLSSTDVYNDKFNVDNKIGKVLMESGISILTVLGITIFRRTLQETK